MSIKWKFESNYGTWFSNKIEIEMTNVMWAMQKRPKCEKNKCSVCCISKAFEEKLYLDRTEWKSHSNAKNRIDYTSVI